MMKKCAFFYFRSFLSFFFLFYLKKKKDVAIVDPCHQCPETKSVYAIICMTERAFILQIISEIAHCYFHIKGKCFTHILSYAAYYNHELAIFSFFGTILNI